MSGKFMSIKRIMIPTLTAVLIASQLCGCASAKESELLSMINNQQSICIEVAIEAQEQKGEEITYDWVELAKLNNYEVFRLNFDDALNVVMMGEGGKNGTMYVDLEGNHTNNSTLYYALMNEKFRNQIGDTDTNAKLVEIAKSNYADVSSDAEAKYAYLNAYFNIFEDSTPNYFDGSSALTRAEFLSGLYRTKNPVSDLVLDQTFVDAVDPDGENEHTIFAQQLLDYSYLNLSEKSLNEQTLGGNITRAEAIYTLVKMFYPDEYEAVTGKEKCFSDAKNGGDIASKQKFIETYKDKETKEKVTVYKDYWMSYELQYAIENPDKGLPDDLYKALVVAKNVGLSTATESRWDEELTKSEALNFIYKIYSNMKTVTNADRGEAVANVNEGNVNKDNNGNGYSFEINTEDINPDLHATFKEENGELFITVDETMVTTFKFSCPEFIDESYDYAKVEERLIAYLQGYHNGHFNLDDWKNFCLTGDHKYLNEQMSYEAKLEWLKEQGYDVSSFLEDVNSSDSDTDLESSVVNSEKDIMNELGIDEGTPSGNTSGNQGGQQSSGGGNVSTPEREDTPSGGGNGFSTEGLNPDLIGGNISTGGSSGTITQEDIDAFNQANGR